MAIYHLHLHTGSRSGGQSAGAKSRYICRLDQYERGPRGALRDAVLATMAGHMPPWAREAGGATNAEAVRRLDAALPYWEAADRHERANGRLFVELEFALPRELSLADQVELIKRFTQDRTTLPDGGKLPYTWALHAGGGKNPHCHLMISERVLDGIARDPASWFMRAAPKGRPAEEGGARKTTHLQHPNWLRETREQWERSANFFLQASGSRERIDHRSNADRGIDAVPGQHVGYGPHAVRRRAANSQRRTVNEAVCQLRAERAQIINSSAASRVPTGVTNHERRDFDQRPDRPGFFRSVAEPGSLVPGAGLGAAVGSPTPDSSRAADEPGAAAPARRAAPAGAPRVRDLSGRGLDERRDDPAGLVHGDPGLGLDEGRASGHRSVRREGTSTAREGDAAWRLTRQRFQAEAQHGWRRPRSKDPLKNASLFWGQLGREMAERIERFLARLAAVKAAEAAAGAGGAAPPEKPATLSKTPTLHRLTATSLRSLDKLSVRDLAEQLQIAEKGALAMHDQWRQALNARDQKWIAACKAQHAARCGRVESLQAEIARREAAAAHAPAPIAVSASKPVEEPMNLMTTERLQEQERIALAAMREAGRLAGAGGADAIAAAKRLPATTARLRAIREELAGRASVAASETPQPIEVLPELARAPVVAPTPELAREAQSQADALRAAVEAAQRSQAERAARHPAVQPTPEQAERARRADYDVPGRRRRT